MGTAGPHTSIGARHPAHGCRVRAPPRRVREREMTEPGLVGLDESYRRMRQQGRRGRRLARPRPEAAAEAAGAAPARRSLRDRLPWLEIFVALQFVWG